MRLYPDGVMWSYGRPHEPATEHELTEAELTALGLWIPPITGEGLTWGPFSWGTEGLTWGSGDAEARVAAIALGLLGKSCWVAIYREDGSVIGYRRVREFERCAFQFEGPYRFNDGTYGPIGSASTIYVEALTDFGEGDAETAHSWAFVIDGEMPVGVKPGVMWLDGPALVGGVKIGDFPIDPPVTLGKTSREQFRAILKII